MNKYEKIYQKALQRSGSSNVSWLDSAIAALAVDVEEYTRQPVKVSGPFGLRAEVYLTVGKNCTVITPSFKDDALKLYYDTGEKTGRHGALTLEDINGFNNVQAPFPDTFEEIAKILTHKIPKSPEGETDAKDPGCVRGSIAPIGQPGRTAANT